MGIHENQLARRHQRARHRHLDCVFGYDKGIDVSPVKESTAVAETLVRENVRALQKEYKGLADSIVASLTADMIKNFSTALADLAKISLPKLDDRQKVNEAYTKAIDNATSADERRAAASARDSAIQRVNEAERKKAAEDAARTAEREADRATRRAEADQKAFDGRLENARKSTAMLQLEFDMLGKTEQQRDKARMQLDLESEAKKRNIELTVQQRASIDEVATAYAAAGEKFRQANGPLASFARQAGDTDKIMQEFALSGVRSLEDGLADVVTGASSASDAFKRMANAIIADLAGIAIRRAITGPIAGALGNLFGGGNEIPGFGTSSFIGPLPGRASGGPVTGGMPYIVGEKRPELFVPNQSGMIIPKVPGMGGGSIDASDNRVITINGGDSETVRQLQAVLAKDMAERRQQVIGIVKSARQSRML